MTQKLRKHKKKADSSDGDVYTRAHKSPLVKKSEKKSKKSKKRWSEEESEFMSLCNDMNDGVALLTTTSNFLSYSRFENIFKSVCTDAGKEVAWSKKVMDNDGKEYTWFLAPKPINGKPPDKGRCSEDSCKPLQTGQD